MAEKINPKRVSVSLAVAVGILSLACALFLAIAPEFSIRLFEAIFHGLDISQIVKPVTFGSAIFGTVEVIIIAMIAGWIFVRIYNSMS